MELGNLEGAKVEVCHVCDVFAECANVFLLDAPERQVRRIRAVFTGYPERPEDFVDLVREFGQPKPSLYTREECPRMMRIREISKARDRNFEAAWGMQIFERLFEFRQAILRPFANEFAGDMEIVHARPVERRERAQFLQRSCQVVRHARRKGDPGKQPHCRLFCHVMGRVRIVHWKATEAGPLIEACRECGFEVEYDDVKFSELAKMIRTKPPDALVIDLTFLPSHGRDTALAFRQTKYARHIPVVFFEGEPGKVEAIRRLLPDAVFVSRKELCSRVKAVCAKPVA